MNISLWMHHKHGRLLHFLEFVVKHKRGRLFRFLELNSHMQHASTLVVEKNIWIEYLLLKSNKIIGQEIPDCYHTDCK
jgi:hypothetical protein